MKSEEWIKERLEEWEQYYLGLRADLCTNPFYTSLDIDRASHPIAILIKEYKQILEE